MVMPERAVAPARFFNVQRLTLGSLARLPLRYDFQPDLLTFLSLEPITSRVEITLQGAQGGGAIPLLSQGPVVLPGVGENQELLLRNLDSAAYTIIVIAQKGYLPTQINAPSVSTGAAGDPMTIEFFISGGGAVPSAGIAGILSVGFNATIVGARLIGQATGTIQVDINKNTFGGYPSMASITASATPVLSAARKYEDLVLTGWTKAIQAGDILEFEVDVAPAPATLTWALISLDVERA